MDFLCFRVLIKYVPNILMILMYVMLYFQMQHMFVVSKISSANQMQNRMSHKKMTQIMKMVTWTIVGFFVVVEVFLIVAMLICLGIENDRTTIVLQR